MGVNKESWEFLDEPNIEQIELQEEKEYETNVSFLNAFSTPHGKKVLEWITLHTLDSPTWWPAQKPEFGYFREGQNSLVRQIKDKIKKAKQYQEKKNDRPSK